MSIPDIPPSLTESQRDQISALILQWRKDGQDAAQYTGRDEELDAGYLSARGDCAKELEVALGIRTAEVESYTVHGGENVPMYNVIDGVQVAVDPIYEERAQWYSVQNRLPLKFIDVVRASGTARTDVIARDAAHRVQKVRFELDESGEYRFLVWDHGLGSLRTLPDVWDWKELTPDNEHEAKGFLPSRV